jgi:hypothetical protein
LSASATSSAASATDAVNGFSTSTCLRARSAAFARRWWVATGVAMAIASRRSSASISSKSVLRRRRMLSPDRLQALGSMSHSQASSVRGAAQKFRTRFGPQ